MYQQVTLTTTVVVGTQTQTYGTRHSCLIKGQCIKSGIQLQIKKITLDTLLGFIIYHCFKSSHLELGNGDIELSLEGEMGAKANR